MSDAIRCLIRKLRLAFYFATALGLLLPGSVRAQDNSFESLKAEVNQKVQQQQSKQALQLLIEHESQHSGDSEYDYLLGVLALENGELSIAEIALERVVLVDPAHAGAWLDLAIVKFRQGNIDTARQIVAHLEQNFNPPVALQHELNKVKDTLQEAQTKQQAWHGMASLSYGYDSNANYGLATDTVTLTPLAGMPVIMQLNQSHIRAGDSAAQLRAQASRRFTYQNGSESQFVVQTLVKKLTEQTDFDLFDFNMAWQHILPLSRDKRWYLSLTPTARYISLGGQTLGEVFTGSAGIFHKIASCDVGSSLDFEKRLYERTAFAGASIPWFTVLAACEHNGFSYGVSARYGLDYPDAKRAGGITDKKELNLFAQKALTDDWVLGVQFYAANYSDRKQYSSLIDNGAVRDFVRLSQKLEVSYKLPAVTHWWLRAEFEHIDDSSNISLSNIQDMQGFLGVRYNF